MNGARVLVLGVAYKKDIDDLRESPALTIIELLQKTEPRSAITIPTSRLSARAEIRSANECAELEDLGQYDCVVIVTDHSDYDYRGIVQEAKLVVDTATPPGESKALKSCTAD